MEYDVHVVQVVTDGPSGFPDDEIVDIGICGVDLDRMDVRSLYSMTVRQDPGLLSKDKIEYIGKGGVSMDDIHSGSPLTDVCGDVRNILKGGTVASFDIRNVFYRYLVNEPWDLTREVSVMPSIFTRLPTSQRCTDPAEENESIRHAYGRMFPDDPMDIGGGMRALDHALMSSAILMELRKRGRY